MAAGLGTRMHPFTAKIPKPFLPVMGVPVIQFAVDALAEAGIREVIVNIHHLPDVAQKELQKIDFKKMKVVLSDESALLLGSAGGLKKAEKYFENECFVYLNGDVMNGMNVSSLIKKHNELQSECKNIQMTLAVNEKSPPGEKYRRMSLSSDKKKLVGFGSAPESEVPFFTGTAVINSLLLKKLKEEPCDFVPKILNKTLVSAGQVGVHCVNDSWIDVGHPSGWRSAHIDLMKALEAENIPSHWKARIEKSSFKLRETVWVQNDSYIPPSISGPAYLAINSNSKSVSNVFENTVAYGDVNVDQLGPNAIYWNGLSAS